MRKKWSNKSGRNGNNRSNNRVKIPRFILTKLQSVIVIGIHIFGDASVFGCFAAAYAVVPQASTISKNLIASKSKLSKSEITIPRLDLIATHMSAKLGINIRQALKKFNVR